VNVSQEQTERTAKIDELSAIANAALTDQPVFERVRRVVLVSVSAAFVVLSFGALYVRSGERLLGLGILAAGVLAVAWCVSVFRRGRRPALVVGPNGLRLFGQSAVLPWSAIIGFGFTETNYTFEVHLDMDRQTPAPVLGVSCLRGAYSEAKSHLQITLLGLNGKWAQQTADTIVSYWRAYHARMELQRMGADAAPVNRPMTSQTLRSGLPSQGAATTSADETALEFNKKIFFRESVISCIYTFIVIASIALGILPALFTIVAVLSGGLAIYRVKKLLDKKPGLVFNRLGIIDNSNMAAVGMTPWSEITDIKLFGVFGAEMLAIKIRDPQKCISKAGMLKKITLKINYRMYGTPIIISLATLRANLSEFKKPFNDYRQKYENASGRLPPGPR